MDAIEIASDRFVCELSAEAEPILEVPRGSVLRISCRSACDRHVGRGPVRAEAANPSTGPVAVAGAEPGHALRIEILEITPAPVGHIAAAPAGESERRYSEIAIIDGFALFMSGRAQRRTAGRSEQARGIGSAQSRRAEPLLTDETIRVPLAPMIGVLGTAPPEGSWTTMDCGVWGGNMDTNDVAPGATVFLPVFRPGGLLVTGDVHAVMGDGEIGGQGLEVAAEVVLRVDIEERPLTGGVYLYRDGLLMTLGTGPTLDEACEAAARAMAGVLVRAGACGRALVDTEQPDEFTAMKFLGLAGDVRVGQLCCPTKSARVAVPVGLVPGLVR